MKKLIMTIICAGFTLLVLAQNNPNYSYDPNPSTGMVQFNSNLPASDLHFYVFSDGFFYNGMHPNHFHNPGIHTTTLFNVGNKEGDNPHEDEDEIVVPPHNGTQPSPFQPISIGGTIEAQLGWNVTTQYNGMMTLSFQNDFSIFPSSGCITFQYNPAAMSVSIWDISTPTNWCQLTSNQPGTITWTYSNLMPDEQRVIYLNTKSFGVAAGSNLAVGYALAPSCANPIVGSTSFTTSNYPHDPNKKIVTNMDRLQRTEGYSSQFNIPQKIVYHVEFQNDGPSPVQNVIALDEIHPKADAASLQFLGSSHPCYHNVSDGLLEVVFEDIFLPGTNQLHPQTYTQEEATGGYWYSVCVPLEINVQECLPTEVEIIFDQQESLFANNSICAGFTDPRPSQTPCVNSFERSAEPTIDYHEESGSIVYPNPARDEINVSGVSKTTKMSIWSNTGSKELFKGSLNNDILTVDIRHLNRGFYILELRSGEDIRYEKFIKVD